MSNFLRSSTGPLSTTGKRDRPDSLISIPYSSLPHTPSSSPKSKPLPSRPDRPYTRPAPNPHKRRKLGLSVGSGCARGPEDMAIPLPTFSGSVGELYDPFEMRLLAWLRSHDIPEDDDTYRKDCLLLCLVPNSPALAWYIGATVSRPGSPNMSTTSFYDSLRLLRSRFASEIRLQMARSTAGNRLEMRSFRDLEHSKEMVSELVDDLEALLVLAGVDNEHSKREYLLRCFKGFSACLKMMIRSPSYDGAVLAALQWESEVIGKLRERDDTQYDLLRNPSRNPHPHPTPNSRKRRSESTPFGQTTPPRLHPHYPHQQPPQQHQNNQGFYTNDFQQTPVAVPPGAYHRTHGGSVGGGEGSGRSQSEDEGPYMTESYVDPALGGRRGDQRGHTGQRRTGAGRGAGPSSQPFPDIDVNNPKNPYPPVSNHPYPPAHTMHRGPQGFQSPARRSNGHGDEGDDENRPVPPAGFYDPEDRPESKGFFNEFSGANYADELHEEPAEFDSQLQLQHQHLVPQHSLQSLRPLGSSHVPSSSFASPHHGIPVSPLGGQPSLHGSTGHLPLPSPSNPHKRNKLHKFHKPPSTLRARGRRGSEVSSEGGRSRTGASFGSLASARKVFGLAGLGLRRSLTGGVALGVRMGKGRVGVAECEGEGGDGQGCGEVVWEGQRGAMVEEGLIEAAEEGVKRWRRSTGGFDECGGGSGGGVWLDSTAM